MQCPLFLVYLDQVVLNEFCFAIVDIFNNLFQVVHIGFAVKSIIRSFFF